MEVVIKSLYSPKKKIAAKLEGKSRTKQSFKDECDINIILKKYNLTGQLPAMKNNPLFGDFSQIQDYQESMNIILKAEEQFNSLPAVLRERFKNDTGAFLDYMNNDANKEEMIKLGLIEAPKELFQTKSNKKSSEELKKETKDE